VQKKCICAILGLNMTNKTTVIKIRVDREVYSKIKKVAEKEDRKYGAQINRILKEWAKKEK